jgi:hypothetical protein
MGFQGNLLALPVLRILVVAAVVVGVDLLMQKTAAQVVLAL